MVSGPNDDEPTSGTPVLTSKSIPEDVLETAPSCSSTKEVESHLDEDILALLGDAPKNDTVWGKPIHKDIAARWDEILVKGLSKEVKEKLLKEYLVPSNCEMLIAPKLNAETKAAMAENLVKRDNMLETKQNQIGSALAALSQAVDSILEKDFTPVKLLKPISDACRLLSDSHYNETKTRRHFIISSINSEMKETMTETVRDKYLFGENVSEKLKSAKTIKKSGTDLKQNKPVSIIRTQKFNKNNFIKNKNQGQSNWRPLQRKPMGKTDAGIRIAQNQQRTIAQRSGLQHREAVDRSPPPQPRQRLRRRL